MQLPESLEKRWLTLMRMAQRVLTVSDEGVTLGKTLIAPFIRGDLL